MNKKTLLNETLLDELQEDIYETENTETKYIYVLKQKLEQDCTTDVLVYSNMKQAIQNFNKLKEYWTTKTQRKYWRLYIVYDEEDYFWIDDVVQLKIERIKLDEDIHDIENIL